MLGITGRQPSPVPKMFLRWIAFRKCFHVFSRRCGSGWTDSRLVGEHAKTLIFLKFSLLFILAPEHSLLFLTTKVVYVLFLLFFHALSVLLLFFLGLDRFFFFGAAGWQCFMIIMFDVV